MSRLQIETPGRAQTVLNSLYQDMHRRISASSPGLCPVDMALNFLRFCHAQSCGKCVPCRVGLGQLEVLIEQVLKSIPASRHPSNSACSNRSSDSSMSANVQEVNEHSEHSEERMAPRFHREAPKLAYLMLQCWNRISSKNESSRSVPISRQSSNAHLRNADSCIRQLEKSQCTNRQSVYPQDSMDSGSVT